MRNSWRYYLAKIGRRWILQWEHNHRHFVTSRFRLWCEDKDFLCNTSRNFKMYASPHDYISHRIFFFQEYNTRLSDLVQYTLRPGHVCWDLGAERGWFSLLMGTIVGVGGRVDSFEVFNPTYNKLVQNIHLNSFDWVHAHNVAVSNKPGKMFFVLPDASESQITSGGHRDCSGIGYISDVPTSSSIEVPVIKLDDFVHDQNLSRLDFVKADIEGSELVAFMGAEYTLKTYRPTLLVEYNNAALQRVHISISDLDLFLRSLNYDIFSAESMQKLDRGSIIASDLQRDVLCIHNSRY